MFAQTHDHWQGKIDCRNADFERQIEEIQAASTQLQVKINNLLCAPAPPRDLKNLQDLAISMTDFLDVHEEPGKDFRWSLL